MSDTIYALSSGALPAAIGIIRISGPAAGSALASLAGGLPPERTPVVRKLRDHEGDTLDVALVLWFPGRRTATGEDLAELHCHGGRAVVAAVLNALAAVPGLREAEPGEFTRRAFSTVGWIWPRPKGSVICFQLKPNCSVAVPCRRRVEPSRVGSMNGAAGVLRWLPRSRR